MSGNKPQGEQRSIAERLHVLRSLSLGQSVAEQEDSELRSYFVKTDQWNKVRTGQADLILGPKGSGKSAIYSLIKSSTDELFDEGILLTAGERPQGTPIFREMLTDTPRTRNDFVNFWKLYFLTLAAESFREFSIVNASARKVVAHLEALNIIDAEHSLRAIFRNILSYLTRLSNGLSEIDTRISIDPESAIPNGLSAKLVFREPTRNERLKGYINVEELLELANSALSEEGITLWIILDRLDVAFEGYPDIEGLALNALFSAYKDLLGYKHIRAKIFLRDDIWRLLAEPGFREASHLTKRVNLVWTSRDLIDMISQRLLLNTSLLKFLGLNREKILAKSNHQDSLIRSLFPHSDKFSFQSIFLNMQDSRQRVTPRELISLFIELRDEQITRFARGQSDGNSLFSFDSLQAAYLRTSKILLTQTFFAEFPDLRKRINALPLKKPTFTTKELADYWELSHLEVMAIGDRLADLGFFTRKDTRIDLSCIYAIPALYCRALVDVT